MFEIFLLESAVWLGLWLVSDYIATLLTLIIGLIVFVVLIIAAMAEWIEPTKVPARYFYVMIISVVAPIVAAVISLYFWVESCRFWRLLSVFFHHKSHKRTH